MSRTTVEITLLEKHEEAVLSLLGDAPDETDSFSIGSDDDVTLVSITIHGVRYGDLGIEKQLQDLNIPYDKSAGAGEDYNARTEYYRVGESGESFVTSFDTDQEYMVSLDDVINAHAANCIGDLISRMTSTFNAMPWEDQSKIL